MKRIKKMKFKKRTTVILLGLFLIIGVPLIVSLGRFIYHGIKDYYLYTQSFYFNSDKLKEDMAHYQIDNWSGVDMFNIVINMNSMKNNRVAATSDITYNITYTCSDNIICDISKENGIIYASSNSDYFVASLTPKVALEKGDEVWIEVHTNATSPYTKELSGKFTMKIGIPGLSYEIVDAIAMPYFDLHITNTLDYYQVLEAFSNYQAGDKIDISTYLSLSDENKDKCASAIITLTFSPNDVRLDMTSSAYLKSLSESTAVIESYDYINSISFKVDAVASESIRFYKSDTTKDYTYPFVNANSIITVHYDI